MRSRSTMAGSVAGMERRRVGQVVGVARAVGRVQVERHVRVVVVHQLDDRARFGRVELHVVAIEVEALRVRALPLSAHRPVLRAAVVEREPLVAVGVVDRRDQEDHRLQPVVVPARPRDRAAASARSPCPRPRRRGCCPGCRRAACRCGAPPRGVAPAAPITASGSGALLVGRAEGREVHAVGGLVDRLQERDDVGVAAGVLEVRLLRHGPDRRRAGDVPRCARAGRRGRSDREDSMARATRFISAASYAVAAYNRRLHV